MWKNFLLLLGGLCLQQLSVAQGDFDVTKVTADPVTLRFSDGQNTVQGFVYYMLQTQTKCCGTDAIYLEVKISAEGKSETARVLTGRNLCMKQSAADVVKLITWDNSNIGAAGKAIYFEVKPSVSCRGKVDDNRYFAVGLPGTNSYMLATGDKPATPGTNQPTDTTAKASNGLDANGQPVASATTPGGTTTPIVTTPPATTTTPGTATPPSTTPGRTNPATPPTTNPARTTPPATVTPPATATPPATTPGRTNTTPPATNPGRANASPPTTTTPTGNDGFDFGDPAITPAKTTPATTSPEKELPKTDPRNTPPTREAPGLAGAGDLPKPVYTSQGNLAPDTAHATTHRDLEAPRPLQPEYSKGQAQLAVFVKKELRDKKVCGLVHVFAEVVIENRDSVAVVVESRILRANRDEVLQIMPLILSKLTYKPETVRRRQIIYFEFKADIVCPGAGPTTNLDDVEDYLNIPEEYTATPAGR